MPIDRREFLASAAAGLVAPSWLSARKGRWAVDDGSRQVPAAAGGEPTRVIVVGAGFAGLAAANALAAAGLETVVLEARSRLGGRVLTADLAGRPVDLGAAWIHDPSGNPLSALARRAGVASRELSINTAIGLAGYFDDEAGWLDVATRTRVLELLSGIGAALPAILERLGERASVADAVDAYFAGAPATPAEAALARSLLATIIETQSSGPLARVSLSEFADGAAEGVRDDVPVGGYERLIDALARRVDVRRGAPVTRIAVRSRGVSVRDAEGRTHRGSHALVTVPLGVLKAGGIAFEPALPARTLAAVDALGFGRFEKLALRFDEAFWADAGPAFLTRGAGPAPAWFDWTPVTGRPTLVAACSAESGERLAALEPRVAVEAGVEQLRRAFGTGVPRPRAAITSRWARDRYTRGAYTYLAVGSTAADIAALATPVHDRLLFAGEATSIARHGYADGAFTSGIREAKRLLQRRRVTITLG